jgi:hypothetical protein
MLELIKRHLGEYHVPKRRGRKPKLRPDGQPVSARRPKPQPVYDQLELRFSGANDED